uniref:hypothetical protein n=1 Tax=Pelomonas sp. KK5 TaxID=1855730 RepID=UPI001301DBFE
ALTGAASRRVLDVAKGGKQPGDARRAVTRMLAQEPDVLRKIAAEPGGRELLDKMVKNLGSSAKSPEDKRFMTEAIKARFNMEGLTGDLTTKALPRLYEVLLIAPVEHTVNNPLLKNIKRNKPGTEASFYTTGTGNITLNLDKTGRKEKQHVADPDDDVPQGIRPKDKEVSFFNHTALHELGHSVDDRLSFMKSKAGQAPYGGWREHTVEEVAEAGAQAKAFYTDNATYPKAFLFAYLRDVLNKGGDPLNPRADVTQYLAAGGQVPSFDQWKVDKGIAQAITDYATFQRDGWDNAKAEWAIADARKLCGFRAPAQRAAQGLICEAILRDRTDPDTAIRGCAMVAQPPDWAALARHDAVQWALQVRLVSKNSGLWAKGGGACTAAAIGGRVYQEAYDGKWVSYTAGARGKGVSQYQFRAPAEWFAELYAAILLKLVPDSHPDAKLLSWIS